MDAALRTGGYEGQTQQIVLAVLPFLDCLWVLSTYARTGKTGSRDQRCIRPLHGFLAVDHNRCVSFLVGRRTSWRVTVVIRSDVRPSFPLSVVGAWRLALSLACWRLLTEGTARQMAIPRVLLGCQLVAGGRTGK